MNPEVDTILALSAQKIAMGFGEQGQAFAQGTAMLLNLMLMMSAQEYDRGADIRVAENADIRKLFADIAPSIGDAALKAKLEAAAKAEDESLRISALNKANDALRRLLTEAQIHAETAGAKDAQKKIWGVLKAMAARRFVSLTP